MEEKVRTIDPVMISEYRKFRLYKPTVFQQIIPHFWVGGQAALQEPPAGQECLAILGRRVCGRKLSTRTIDLAHCPSINSLS